MAEEVRGPEEATSLPQVDLGKPESGSRSTLAGEEDGGGGGVAASISDSINSAGGVAGIFQAHQKEIGFAKAFSNKNAKAKEALDIKKKEEFKATAAKVLGMNKMRIPPGVNPSEGAKMNIHDYLDLDILKQVPPSTTSAPSSTG